jgi:hypothetical protein
MKPRNLLLPNRLRTIERPFGWIPCRLLQEGYLKKMSAISQKLYLMLTLTSDRRGISFYSEARTMDICALCNSELSVARQGLMDLDLLAFDEEIYQLLSLPSGRAKEKIESPIHRHHEAAHLSIQERTIPEEARQMLRRALGEDFF